MYNKLINLFLLAVLVQVAVDYAYAGQNLKVMNYETRLASTLNETMQVEIIDYSAEYMFNPDVDARRRLSARQDFVIRYMDNLTSPLVLYYDILLSDGAYDSIKSSIVIDSALVYNDSTLLFMRDGLEPNRIDTLSIWFFNRADFRGRHNPATSSRLYPNYYGIFYSCPFPSNYTGYFNVSLEISAPDSFVSVSMGQLEKTEKKADGYSTATWKTLAEFNSPPAFIIDKFDVSVIPKEGGELSIYHLDRPDSVLNRISEWHFETLNKYYEWFGPIDYTSLNIIENKTFGTFSLPGSIFFHEGHFGGKPYMLFPTELGLFEIQNHELAHQWWSVTVYGPSENKWLAEGWAEYSALKATYPQQKELANYLRKEVQPFIRTLPEDFPLIEPPLENPARFYEKGPWILYMLERMLGEESFFNLLKDYKETYNYKIHSLDDFFGLAETHYSMELGWFKEQWFERSGYPKLYFYKEYETGDGDMIQARFIVEQLTEPYRLSLELGFYYPNSIDPEIYDFLLNSRIDSLELVLPVVPDSVILDPDFKLLVDIYYAEPAELAPFGDTPNDRDDYEIRFFIDSTQVYEDIDLYYSVNGGQLNQVPADLNCLNSGYGSISIPSQNPGTKIDYYFKYKTAGLQYYLPKNYPDSVYSFSILNPMDIKNYAFISFTDFSTGNRHLLEHQEEHFPEYKHGMACFNPLTFERYGTLYGVGYEAPQIDRETFEYIAYNPELHSIDVVDLNSWCLKERISAKGVIEPPEAGDLKFFLSTYSQKYRKYYLLDNNFLYEADLLNGEIGKLLGEQEENDFSLLPRQLEYWGKKSLLFLKKGYSYLLFNPLTKSTIRELRFNGHEEFVHMRDDGILVSVEYKGDFQTNNQTYDNYRLIYRKYKLVDQPVLIDSCVADFKLWDGFPFLDGGDAVQFVDALDKVMINWRLNSRSRLVWDLAGNSDSIHVFSFSSFLTHPAAAFIAESGNSLGLVPSSNGSTIALFSLNSVDLLYSFYSPFNGEFYDNPIVTDKRITGIIASDHTYFKGDIDSNGKTDIFDLIEMLKRLKDKSLPYDRHYDLNNDNKVNIFDFLEMLRIISR